ncbi:MAG: cytochrome c oxidase assembly protein [Candidatus Bipolaricaulia bacterium]
MRIRVRLFNVLTLSGGLQLLAGAQPAHAHGRLGHGQNPLTAWNLTPEVVIGTVLMGILYVIGLRRWKDPSHPVTLGQRVSFFAGLAAIFLALQSPVDPVAEHLFFVHQIQHLLLRMIGPALLLLGRPLTPILRGLPARMRQNVIQPIVENTTARRLYGFLTHPVGAPLSFISTMYFWQAPGTHNLALRNDLVHYLMHATMLFTGLLFWWLIIDPRSRLSYGLRLLVLGLVIIPNTALGALITFSDQVLYSAYGEVERLLDLSLLTDQQIGGLILWIPGDMMSFMAAGIIFMVWFQQEEKQRTEEDQELAQ